MAPRSRLLVLLCATATFVLSLGLLFWHRDSIGQLHVPEIHVPERIWHIDVHKIDNHEPESHGHEETETPVQKTDKVHYLLPASNKNVNLCKTLLTGTILGYPAPTLIGWDQKFDKGGLLGGGSHIIKISGVLEQLDAMDSSHDNELVFMMDAYDIWFQLPLNIMITRYHAAIDEANERLLKRLGNAVEKESLKETIIFGAGKRCAPNSRHTVPCYPIPESPLPADLYGPNTDTSLGRNLWTSSRQRFLNSGYIIGPVKDMRALFRRALEKVEATPKHWAWDDGSGKSDDMYHGSDQSIFATMYGEQEFQREVMRRRHLTALQRAQGAGNPKKTSFEGVPVDDPLKPSFTHQVVEHKEGKPDEFGITLDVFSSLIQQTVNSEHDAAYLKYGEPLGEQIGGRGLFDCKPRVSNSSLASDIRQSPLPSAVDEAGKEGETGWAEVPLYTNLCLDRVPVMIHHNGDKGAREGDWTKTWMAPRAKQMLEAARKNSKDAGGAYVDGKGLLGWRELCPAGEMDKELFRG